MKTAEQLVLNVKYMSAHRGEPVKWSKEEKTSHR
jgi:hypothetical protein